MSKLTKEEIKYIDNYLIKNEVKFWDMRLELLDHIVSAVEEKIETEGISFNEALLEVHHSFGNKLNRFDDKKGKSLTRGLYLNNKGFKIFIRKKERQIRKKQIRQYWVTFLPFIFSIRFLIEAITVSIIMLFASTFSFKHAYFTITFLILFIEFYKVLYGGFKKFQKKSLNIISATSMFLLITQIPFMILQVFDWFFENISNKPYYVPYIAILIILIFSRHSFNNYKTIYNTYKYRYNLINE